MADQLNLGLEEPAPYEPKKNILEKVGDFIKERYDEETARREEEMRKAEEAAGPGASGLKKGLYRFGGAMADQFKDLGAQYYGMKNAATMGAYDALVKVLSKATKSSAYDKLKEFKKKHKTASEVGGLQGTIAGMAMPSGGLLKAASGGAKALKAGKVAAGLAKAADIASGAAKVGKGANILSRAGAAALRGGLAGAEQAIPRGIIQAVESGDIGKAAKGAALGTALGAGLGGGLQVVGEGLKGLGGLASRFAQSKGIIKAPGGLKGLAEEGAGAIGKGKGDISFITDPLEEKLLKDTVKGRLPDLNTGTLMKGLKSYAKKIGVDPSGYVRTQGKEALESLVGIMDEYGARNVDDLQDLIEGAGGVFDKAYKVAAAKGITPATIMASTLDEGGELAAFAAEYGDEATDIVGQIMKKVGEAPDIRTAKAGIDKLMRHYRKVPTFAGEGAVDLLASLKTKIDDAILDVDPDLAKAKTLWKGLAPIKELLARDEIDLPTLMSGSPTAEKTALTGAIKSAITGTGDPAAIAAAAGASAIGQKSATGIQQVTGFLKGEIANALRKPENLEKLKAGIAGVKNIAGGIGKAAGALPEIAPKIAGAAPSVLERAAEAEPAIKEALDPEGQDAQEAKASAQASEAAVTPEAAQEAKDEVKTAWAEKVEDNIRTAFYQYGIADRGYSYEDFLGAVREVTNDFDPTIAAEIVFSDKAERAAFLKDYDKALQYKALDVGQALDKSPIFFGPTGEQKASREALTDYIARVAGEDPMLMDAKKKKKIADTVKEISGMKGSAADKQSALLRQLQANYGVNYKQLADFGLLGVV